MFCQTLSLKWGWLLISSQTYWSPSGWVCACLRSSLNFVLAQWRMYTHTKTTGTYPQGVTADAFGFDTDSFSEFTQFSHQNVYSHSLLSAKRRDVQFDGIKIKCFHTRKLTWKQSGLAEDKSLSHTHTHTHPHTHTHTHAHTHTHKAASYQS